MLPYLFIFLVSIMITFVGQKIYLKHKEIAIIFFMITFLILSLFSALRDFSVGTDINVYGLNYFNLSKQYSTIREFLVLFHSEQMYLIVNFIFSHIFGNIRSMFFAMTFFQLSIIYYYVLKENYKNITLSLFIYLMIYYNTSFNILRQTFAIFIILIAYKCLIQKKNIKFIMFIILAYFFHSSSLIMLLLMPINYLSNSKHPYRNLIIISLLMLFTFSSLSILLDYSSILPLFIRKYLGYLRNPETNLNLKFLLYKIIFLMIFLKSFKYCKDDSIYINYLYFSIFDIMFYFLSNFIKYGYRLSYYFLVFYIFSIPYILDKKIKYSESSFYIFIIIISLIGYWIIRYVIIGYDGTIPYII